MSFPLEIHPGINPLKNHRILNIVEKENPAEIKPHFTK